MIEDRSDRHCIIGAGYSGIALACAFQRAGLSYDQLEGTGRIGGNWSHGVYDSTHLISSKNSTQYVEYPMPEEYPTFPSATQMLAYLESYVDHFELGDHIEFDTEVARVWPVDRSGLAGWYVELADGSVRHYQGITVANGHYWEQNLPVYPGEFTGHQIHSKDYKRPADFGDGDRVLVVGAGNSASDLAVEAATTFGTADISMRRGYWFIPKTTVFGIPSSELDRIWVPKAIMRAGFKQALRLSYGDYHRYGLERPDHNLFDKDVTVNSSLMYALLHGKVTRRPEIARFDGNVVHFTDGSKSTYDTIVWGTGFKTRFPMLDETMFVWENGQPLLVEHVLVPRYANIYVWGLVAPRSGAGRILSAGAAFVAEAVNLQQRLDEPLSDVAARFVPARSEILAGSAEILGHIRLGRLGLRALAARTAPEGKPMSLPAATKTSRAVITGASSGIGEELAESLARRGHSLILVARREERLRALAERLIATYDVAVEVSPCDLADREDRAKLVANLAGVDVSVVCLNAGFATYGSFSRLDPAREREQVEVNVVAVHDLAVALVPRLVARGSGAVLITGSTAGNQPSPNNATYAATKAFANTLSESLHGELKGTGVTCTLLAPGPVRTEFGAVADLGRIEKLLPAFAWVDASDAAETALDAVTAGRRRVVPGAVAKVQTLGGQYAPRSIMNPLLRRVYGDLR